MIQTLLRAYGLHLARRSIRPEPPARSLRSLRESVDVFRDGHGVAHVFARNTRDLFFAQGFVTAEDRLFQMDLLRRVARGRLSEILGDEPVAWEDLGIRFRGRRLPELDRYLRILGMHRAAAAALAVAGGEAREALAGYAEGVNARIETLERGELPVEMKLLGYRPEPWTPVDSLCVVKVMALELSFAYKHKLALLAVAERLSSDPERLQELLPPAYRADAPRVVVSATALGERARKVLGADGQFRPFLGWAGSHLGSNWCVLGPERTTTGKPLLLNDPHVQLTMPSLFYPVHLAGGPYDVTGASLPGGPGVALGHNRRIAWGCTNVMADDVDLYLETPHPQDPLRYQVEGPGAGDPKSHESSKDWKYARFDVTDEAIQVRGERAPRPFAVRISRHGPIISDAFLTPDSTLGNGAGGAALARGPLIAMRWTAHLPSSELDTFLAIDRAEGWTGFVDALRTYCAPAQNFCYADVVGNFGYYVGGRFPIRANGKSILPASGARGDGEWIGFVPFEENPHASNPKAGYLVSANNKVVDDGYPYYLSEFWEPPHRARRIHQIVHERGKVSPEDGARLMLDVRSLEAEELVNALIRPIADRLKEADGDVQVAVNYLLNWDHTCATDSIAAALFYVFQDELLAEVFRPALGDETFAQLLETWNEHVESVARVLMNPSSAFFRERSRDEAVARALGRTVARLAESLGPATQSWGFGRLHQLTLRHAFHGRAALRKLFDVGPFPNSGSGTTINNGQWIAAHPFAQVGGAGFRHVADLSDLEAGSRFVIPGGASANPASPHHTDLLALWRGGQLAPMPMGRAAIEKVASSKVVLEPVSPVG